MMQFQLLTFEATQRCTHCHTHLCALTLASPGQLLIGGLPCHVTDTQTRVPIIRAWYLQEHQSFTAEPTGRARGTSGICLVAAQYCIVQRRIRGPPSTAFSTLRILEFFETAACLSGSSRATEHLAQWCDSRSSKLKRVAYLC